MRPALPLLLLAVLLAGLLAGCSQEPPGPPGPGDTPPPRAAFVRTCPEGSEPLPDGGACAKVFWQPERAVMAQHLAVSPDGAFAVAVYAPDAAFGLAGTSAAAPPVPAAWILVSTDDGATWQRRELPSQPPGLVPHQVAFLPDGSLHVLADRGGLEERTAVVHWSSPDLGQTWGAAGVLGETRDGRLMALQAHGDALLAAYPRLGRGLEVAVSRDGGATWTAPEGSIPDGCPDHRVVAATTQSGIALLCGTMDGAVVLLWNATSGTVAPVAEAEPAQCGVIDCLGIGSDGGRRLVAALQDFDGVRVWESRDEGATWTDTILVEPPLPDGWEYDAYGPASPAFDAAGGLHLRAAAHRPGAPGDPAALLEERADFDLHVAPGGSLAGANAEHLFHWSAAGTHPMQRQAIGVGYYGPSLLYASSDRAMVEIVAGRGAFAIGTFAAGTVPSA
jgi:hypothetical protein